MIVIIGNLCTESSCFKECRIPCIGGNKPHLNTTFQHSNKHKALRCRDVSADDLHPLCTACIDNRIHDGAGQHKYRQIFFTLCQSALVQRDRKGGQCTNDHPSDDKIIANRICIGSAFAGTNSS